MQAQGSEELCFTPFLKAVQQACSICLHMSLCLCSPESSEAEVTDLAAELADTVAEHSEAKEDRNHWMRYCKQVEADVVRSASDLIMLFALQDVTDVL